MGAWELSIPFTMSQKVGDSRRFLKALNFVTNFHSGCLTRAGGPSGEAPLSIIGDVGAAVLDFLEQDGETLDERHQRWGQALQAHPRFEEAIRLSMHKSLVRYGQTPLMAASWAGDVPTVTALLGAGAKLTTKDGKGVTALGWAVQGTNHGCYDVIRILKKAGARE